MTYREIFDAALSYLCESNQSSDVSDYEERARYILATGVSHCISLDKRYRQSTNKTVPIIDVKSYVDPDGTMPLSDVFVPALTYYLASMLCLDENESLSEKLFDLYSDEMASISCSLLAKKAPISDAYQILT